MNMNRRRRIKKILNIAMCGVASVISMASCFSYSQSVSADSHKHERHWQQWKTVGEAQLSWLLFDIYISRLMSPTGKYHVSTDISPHPFALEMLYQRDITQEQLLEATDEQWEKLGFSQGKRSRWGEKLQSMFPNIKEGDALVYLTNGTTGQLLHREVGTGPFKPVGTVSDEQLNDAFLSIWLSPNTEYPKLRKQLIGREK
ncbi:hypothetical protein VAZ01S_070_00360 [Vibrio azureus NBRC 104587]|uniref:Chalcone isomerase domain-containing protein n=2 Tax=Vibrio azureus TaxID=512649 RepID=U3C7I6_9VIBR|nr:hypothetical protein VAZ01S_070_00360 [Vibrio azureus NBRC 104587]